MIVLQINVCYGYASTGRNVQEIAETLDKRNIENYVAYFSAKNPRKKDYKIGSAVGERIHSLFSHVFGLQGYFSTFSTKALLKYMDNIKPDVVHLNNLHGNYININLLLDYLGKNNIATVITLHDCFFYTGKCCYYTIDKCNRWLTGCGDCPRLKKDNASYIFDNTKKMYRDKKYYLSKIPRLGIVGVSDWITNEARKSFLKNVYLIDRVYNWVDLDLFKPKESKFREVHNLKDAFVLLGVATEWTSRKGIDEIIILANKLMEYTFVLVGDISQDIELPSNIIHIKNTNNVQELIDIYNAADVFINPSMEETFGKVTAEALSCGVPVIVKNSTASPELVGPNCGYILKNNTIDEFLESIEEIKNKGKDYYIKSCRVFAEQNFDKAINIGKQIDFYNALLEDKK